MFFPAFVVAVLRVCVCVCAIERGEKKRMRVNRIELAAFNEVIV